MLLGQAEDGAGEQAVEHVDAAMVEVMGAELLHPPRADASKSEDSSAAAPWLPANERPIAAAGGQAQRSSGVGMETHLQGAGDAGGGGEAERREG